VEQNERLKDWISAKDFESAFGVSRRDFYADFVHKLDNELGAAVHPSADVQDLRLVSVRKDAGGNTHARLVGNINFLGESGTLGGEFVWLDNLRTFRGKAWSSLAVTSDEQLLLNARSSFRQEAYLDAKRCLDAIQDKSQLSRSFQRWKDIIDRKLD
jgi:hypothetical protein